MNMSLEDRVTKLLVHGICHLLGYDHELESDWRSMRAKEAYILKKLGHGIPRPGMAELWAFSPERATRAEG